MRSALYAELTKLYPVYYIGNGEKTAKKPFLILQFEHGIKTRLGSWNMVTVSVYAPAGDFELLDTACEKVITALDGKHLKRISSDGVFLVQYVDCSSDLIEDSLGAISKQLNFKIPVFGGDFM